MRPIVILAATLITAAAAMPADAAQVGWKLRTAFDGRYDDNILELSDFDIDRLHNPHPNDATRNRFSIETEDDFIAIPQVTPTLFVDWLHGAPTTFSADLTAYQYTRNSIKDYQSYHLSIGQALHRNRKYATTFTATGGVIPSYYLRNLVDTDAALAANIPNLRSEATYRKESIEGRIDQVIVPDRLRLMAAYGEESRNYNDDFNERDSEMPYAQVFLGWDPTKKETVRLRFGYRKEDLVAEGDLPDTPWIENDVSSQRRLWSTEARFRWGREGRRQILHVAYVDEHRDYTSDNPLDFYHYAREDHRRYYTLDFQANLRKGWFFEAGAQHEVNNSTFPSIPTGLQPDDITDYAQNIFDFGFGYQFGEGEKSIRVRPPQREKP
jgi:hypothetical protein